MSALMLALTACIPAGLAIFAVALCRAAALADRAIERMIREDMERR